jgi:hypothetical protein
LVLKDLDACKTEIYSHLGDLISSETIDKHFNKLEKIQSFTNLLLDPQSNLSDDHHELLAMLQIESSDKWDILKKILDMGIITYQDLELYTHTLGVQNYYPDWFLDNSSCFAKLLDNLLQAVNVSSETLQKQIKKLTQSVSSEELATFLNKLIGQPNNELERHLEALGKHAITLLEHNREKGKAIFEIFLIVKNLAKKTHENTTNDFDKIIKEHKDIIEKHEGIKWILSCIYKFLFGTSNQGYSFFKPLTTSEELIEKIKKNMPNKDI